jgi:hypothetical protein
MIEFTQSDVPIWKITMAKKAKKETRPLVVTLSGERAVHDVAKDLKAAGFAVDQVLDAIGVVTGSAEASGMAKLRKIRGVADVSADHKVDIGPPDSPVS